MLDLYFWTTDNGYKGRQMVEETGLDHTIKPVNLRERAQFAPAPDVSDPVIQVIDQSNGEIVYSLRIQGKSFEPKVRRAGLYTVKVLEPDEGYERVHKDLKASP